MRRSLFALCALVALTVFANPVDAQFRVGAQGAMMTGLDQITISGTTPMVDRASATYGLGARVMLDPPLFPVAVVGSGTYYFPEGDGSYYTLTAAAQLRLPLPIIKPYVTGGYQIRKSDDGSGAADSSSSNNGLMAGIGVQLDFALSFFLEGTFEFGDDYSVELTPGTITDLDDTPLVIKAGVIF